MKTRAIPTLITALLAFSLVSCTIDPEKGNESDSLSSAKESSSLSSLEEAKGNISFVLNEDGQSYSVTGDINYLVTGEIIVPSTYNGLPVTRVKEKAFSHSHMSSIRLPDTIIEIGEYAFGDCYGLREVSFGNGLTIIGDYAFAYSPGIEKISIPDSTITIGKGAFLECSYTKFLSFGKNLEHIGDNAFRGCTGISNALILPEGLTHIGECAFNSTSITMAYIPKSVDYIGYGAFTNNSLFEHIGVDVENETYSSINGVLYDKSQNEVLCFPGAKSPFYIPETVSYIGDTAYWNCAYIGESLVIPDNIIKIGDSAFHGNNNLKTVTLGSNVAVMGDAAFGGCLNLVEVNLNEGLTAIPQYCFNCTDIASLSLPSTIVSIDKRAFSSCGLLESLTINRGLKSIEDDAFQFCDNLTALNYEGTMSEWNQIDRSENWLSESSVETVHCSDGDVSVIEERETI